MIVAAARTCQNMREASQPPRTLPIGEPWPIDRERLDHAMLRAAVRFDLGIGQNLYMPVYRFGQPPKELTQPPQHRASLPVDDERSSSA